MKAKLLIIFTLFCLTSCKSQDKLNFKYQANTRGYDLNIELVNKSLNVNENGLQTSLELTNEQYNKVLTLIETINFDTLKVENLEELHQVDRAIPANLTIVINEKTYSFDLTHNSNPKISKFLDLILSFRN